MDWSKDRWEQACGRPAQCGFLRRVWPYSASGNPGSTCFYGRAGVPGAQSAVFSRAAEAREFQKHVFLLASGASGAPDAVFSRLLSASLGVPGSGGVPGPPEGAPGGPFPDVRENAGPPGPRGAG